VGWHLRAVKPVTVKCVILTVSILVLKGAKRAEMIHARLKKPSKIQKLLPQNVIARESSSLCFLGTIMKRYIISGAVVIILGLLIALGPQFLFKVCAHGEDGFPHCHWSAQAEVGIGLLIAALGACMIIFTDLKTHLGLTVGVFMASIVALAIPHTLIGGCGMISMQCRRVAFPALTAESIVLLLFSAITITVIAMQKPPVQK
jgi:drug/metabolite transporter (DMT)-like permease